MKHRSLVTSFLLAACTTLGIAACALDTEGEPGPQEDFEVLSLPTASGRAPTRAPSGSEPSGDEVRPELPLPPAVEAGTEPVLPDSGPGPSPAPDASVSPLDASVSPPDASVSPPVDADFERALASTWRLECTVGVLERNWAGGPLGGGSHCDSPHTGPRRPLVLTETPIPAVSQDIVATVSGTTYSFLGTLMGYGTARQVAIADASRSMGPDATHALGTAGSPFYTGPRPSSPTCKWMPYCSPRVPAGETADTFGANVVIRRTTLADGARLYWMAASPVTAAPNDETEVPFYTYSSCALGGEALARRQACRLYRVERP